MDKAQTDVPWGQLPGPSAPEMAVVEALTEHPDGASSLASELRLGATQSEAFAFLTALRATQDVHHIPYDLGEMAKLPMDQASRALCRAVVRLSTSPLADIGEQISQCLEGKTAVNLTDSMARR